MDSKAALARKFHLAALSDNESAARNRHARNELVMQLRRDDPERWTHAALAKLLDCSPELIAKITRGFS